MDLNLRTIYLEQFPLDTSEDTLRELFSIFGKIERINLPLFRPEHPLCHGRERLKTKGYAFVVFSEKATAEQAFKFFNDYDNVLSITSQTGSKEISNTNTSDFKSKILFKSEYRDLMPLRVMMKQKYLELEKHYEEQRMKSLIKCAKLLVIACPNLYGQS